MLRLLLHRGHFVLLYASGAAGMVVLLTAYHAAPERLGMTWSGKEVARSWPEQEQCARADRDRLVRRLAPLARVSSLDSLVKGNEAVVAEFASEAGAGPG